MKIRQCSAKLKKSANSDTYRCRLKLETSALRRPPCAHDSTPRPNEAIKAIRLTPAMRTKIRDTPLTPFPPIAHYLTVIVEAVKQTAQQVTVGTEEGAVRGCVG